MRNPDRFILRDFMSAVSAIGLIVLSSIGMMLNAAVVLFVVVAGVFVLFDESYAVLFKPWIVVCGIYLVLSMTYLLYRPAGNKVVVVVQNRHETRHLLNVVQQMQPVGSGRFLPIKHAVTGQDSHYNRQQILWLQADGQVQFAHVGQFSASLCQRDGVWWWQVVRNGIVDAEGSAVSEAEAKAKIDGFLYDGLSGEWR